MNRLHQLLDEKTGLQFEMSVNISFELDLDNWSIVEVVIIHKVFHQFVFEWLGEFAVSEGVPGHFLSLWLILVVVLMFSLFPILRLLMILPDAVPGFRFDPPSLNVSKNKCQKNNWDQDPDKIHCCLDSFLPGPRSELWQAERWEMGERLRLSCKFVWVIS